MAPHENNLTKPHRLDVWGKSLLNKLSARSRRKRKRAADKKRRTIFKRALTAETRADTQNQALSENL